MMEWKLDLECPHCGHEQNHTASFDSGCFDECGGISNLMRIRCSDWNCDKEFWFTAAISFDVSAEKTFKRKPKGGE